MPAVFLKTRLPNKQDRPKIMGERGLAATVIPAIAEVDGVIAAFEIDIKPTATALRPVDSQHPVIRIGLDSCRSLARLD